MDKSVNYWRSKWAFMDPKVSEDTFYSHGFPKLFPDTKKNLLSFGINFHITLVWFIFTTEPPSLDISVLRSDTSQVTVTLSSAARLDNVEVFIDKILTHKYETFNLSQNLVIDSLMSGKQYHLQVRFKTGELSWKKNKNISTSKRETKLY